MIFIKQGDKPLTEQQLQKRTQAYIDHDYSEWARERAIRTNDSLFSDYMSQVALDTDVNRVNNLFNQQLLDYSQAIDRLSRYVLLDGLDGVVDPLPEFINSTQYDEATDSIVTVQVRNPLIVQDEAERAEAQEVIDSTPAEVVAFYDNA